MAGTSSKPPANGFVAFVRHIYNPIGFSKGYNFVLWFICFGALMGFSLARFMLLDYHGVFCKPIDGEAAPGECYSYATETYREVGIRMHLYTIIPAGFLACFQFVPIIRYKALLFHRINGYVVSLLSLAGTVGALMIARVSFGGGLDVQTALGTLAIMFVGSITLAIYNVKRLQLEQHRAWMLRAWVYAGTIVTTRLIMITGSMIISSLGGFYYPIGCDKLGSFYGSAEELLAAHPGCTSSEEIIAVQANMDGPGPEYSAAALYSTFGIGLWLSAAIHAFGVELYLRLTPAEFERLRNISYTRQVEAGMRNPGRAGLTVDRLGDSALWVPEVDHSAGEGSGVSIVMKQGNQSATS